ncbi:VOC family protein [Chryseolinea soli]|uniref:VOC family protein n=1 Tax=Chryseolinea soli TaxID=2321403 RepID=A0A385SVL7_9BACT|nr:VOC family protein [Chryseolinea soli]AYB34862.1 VOC family protein [Chryseolinea soli]
MIVIRDNKLKLKFDLFALSVKDIDLSVSWYENVLGFVLVSKTEFKAINAKGAFLDGMGIRLELLQPDRSIRLEEMCAEPPEHFCPIGRKSLILIVNDLDELSTRLEGKDIDVIWQKLVICDDRIRNTMLRDVDGNFLIVFERKKHKAS